MKKTAAIELIGYVDWVELNRKKFGGLVKISDNSFVHRVFSFECLGKQDLKHLRVGVKFTMTKTKPERIVKLEDSEADTLRSKKELFDMKLKTLHITPKVEKQKDIKNLALLSIQSELGKRFKEAILMVDGNVLDTWNEGHWAVVESVDKKFSIESKRKDDEESKFSTATSKQKVMEVVEKVLLGDDN